MKANELMIGDWLKHYNGTPMQVTKITTVHFACAKNGGANCWEYNNKFEPIPLTTEILEKNGFYRGEIPTRDEIGHYYHRKTAPSSIFVSMSFDDGRDFGNEIKHVHELQHTLRLCGINKEIVV